MSPHPDAFPTKAQNQEIEHLWRNKKRGATLGLKAIIDANPDKKLSEMADSIFRGLNERFIERTRAANEVSRLYQEPRAEGVTTEQWEDGVEKAIAHSTVAQRNIELFIYDESQKVKAILPDKGDREPWHFIGKVIKAAIAIHKDVLSADVTVADTAFEKAPSY